MNRSRLSIDKFFKNNNGEIVVFQKPNAPLLIWALSTLLVRIETFSDFILLRVVAMASLLLWAGLELLAGDSPFRRGLGAVVLLVFFVRFLR